jgi:lipid A 4'-phosphatase
LIKYALMVGFIMALILALMPGLDLSASRTFYFDGHFVGEGSVGLIGRDIARLAPLLLFGGLALLHVARRLGWRAGRYAPDGRSLAFLAFSLALGPGLLVNGILKEHVHRPRPVQIREFGGRLDFQPPDRLAGPCPRNCSFPSGEAAAGFWLAAPASLAPLPLRPILMATALLFGTATGLLRVAAGAHFLSDVLYGGLITLAVIAWLRRLLWPAPAAKRESGDRSLAASPASPQGSIAPIP